MKIQDLPEPMVSTTKSIAIKIIQDHIMSSCDDWTHGYIDYVWYDEQGNICIRYDDGKSFHYKYEGSELKFEEII